MVSILEVGVLLNYKGGILSTKSYSNFCK